MLTEQFKGQIAKGVQEYLDAHREAGMSQAKIAKMCDIKSQPYIGYILAGQWDAVPGGSSLGRISDSVFLRLQQGLGLRMDLFETENFLALTDCLMTAKVNHQWRIADGLKGTGKSFAAEEFARKNPKETFLVRGKRNMNQKEFMQAIARAIGANDQGTPYRIGQAIAERLLTMTYPLLIIDEAENLFKRNSEGGFAGLKDLYDDVKKRCAVVLIGANKFREALEKRANNLTGCFPQLYSRCKANGLELARLSREDVALIGPAYGVTAKKELDFLFDTMTDFRELFDTLEQRQADAVMAATRLQKAA